MSCPVINIDSILITNVFNKISPKILSPEKNSNFCSNNPKETGVILLNLRNLYKFSIEEISNKLTISSEEYRNLEKGYTNPSKDLSKRLYQLFEIV